MGRGLWAARKERVDALSDGTACAESCVTTSSKLLDHVNAPLRGVTGCDVPGTSVEADRSLGPSHLLDAWHMLSDLGNRVTSAGGSLAIAMNCDRPSAPTRNRVRDPVPLAFICGDSERVPDMCGVS